MTAETEFLANLNTKTQKRVKLASEVRIERLAVPSVGLNLALDGGIAHRHQTLLWGNKSAGKSSFCASLCGEALRTGKTAAYIDSEGTFDPKWAERLGVDVGSLIYASEKTTQGVGDLGTDLIKSGVDLLIVDSISSLLPGSYFVKDSTELKGMEGTIQIGSLARDLGVMVNMFSYANTNTAIVLVSQVRNKFLQNGAMLSPTGGLAVEFMSSTIIKLWSTANPKDQIIGDVHFGDKIYEEPVGREVKWNVTFNKLAAPMQTGNYNFFYKGADIGIDHIGETLGLAEKYGVIQKKGSWYDVYGKSIQGDIKAAAYLRENEAVLTQVTKEVYQFIEQG